MPDISSYTQYNPARSTSYIFTITGFRDISFKLQNAAVPDVNLGGSPFPTRTVDIMIPSNKLAYDPVPFNFLVSEDLREWIEVYKWMDDLTRLDGQNDMTAELTILDSVNRPVARFLFTGVYPLMLGGLQYSMIGQESVLSCNLTLQFDEFQVESLVSGEHITHGN